MVVFRHKLYSMTSEVFFNLFDSVIVPAASQESQTTYEGGARGRPWIEPEAGLEPATPQTAASTPRSRGAEPRRRRGRGRAGALRDGGGGRGAAMGDAFGGAESGTQVRRGPRPAPLSPGPGHTGREGRARPQPGEKRSAEPPPFTPTGRARRSPRGASLGGGAWGRELRPPKGRRGFPGGSPADPGGIRVSWVSVLPLCRDAGGLLPWARLAARGEVGSGVSIIPL